MNVHSLPRSIPAEVKRAVRQRCGFGCIICGASIYEYDHFDPPFFAAAAHDPAGITLLCPTHHAEKTRGLMPLEVIRDSDANPAARRKGQTTVTRPVFEHIPTLSIAGTFTVVDTPIPIMIRGVPPIQFKEPEAGSNITRIDATITDLDGEHLVRIVDNEWIVESGVWDYEWVGPRMTIRDAHRSIALQITVFPPKAIHIDRLQFKGLGYDVKIDEASVRINTMMVGSLIASHCGVGLGLS